MNKSVTYKSPENISLPDVFFQSTESPKCPIPTLLDGLQPFGIGTGACESLSSYITRLADAHRISVYALVKDVLGEKLTSSKRKWCTELVKLRAYLPIGGYTSSMVTALTEATSADGLAFCTMLPLRHALRNNLLAREARHCPICFEDASQSSHLYGHLVWDIACVTACPIHAVQLEASRCGAPTNKHLKKCFSKVLAGVCPTCGSIGYRCKGVEPVRASAVEIWKAQQVAQVISCFPEADKTFSKRNLAMGLNLLIDAYAEGKPAIAARRAGIHKSVLWGWIQEKYAPSLAPLLDLCLVAGVSLVSVMRGKPMPCPSPSFHPMPLKRRAQKATTEERKIALTNALVVIPPLSLRAVARQLGLDDRTLKETHPELSASVLARYRQFVSDRKRDHLERANKMGQALISELKAKGLSVTGRNIRATIGDSFGPWTLLHQVISKALTEQSVDKEV